MNISNRISEWIGLLRENTKIFYLGKIYDTKDKSSIRERAYAVVLKKEKGKSLMNRGLEIHTLIKRNLNQNESFRWEAKHIIIESVGNYKLIFSIEGYGKKSENVFFMNESEPKVILSHRESLFFARDFRNIDELYQDRCFVELYPDPGDRLVAFKRWNELKNNPAFFADRPKNVLNFSFEYIPKGTYSNNILTGIVKVYDIENAEIFYYENSKFYDDYKKYFGKVPKVLLKRILIIAAAGLPGCKRRVIESSAMMVDGPQKDYYRFRLRHNQIYYSNDHLYVGNNLELKEELLKINTEEEKVVESGNFIKKKYEVIWGIQYNTFGAETYYDD